MPNMKHEIETPGLVIGLWNIPNLSEVTADEDGIRIGAMCTVHDLGEHELINAKLPSLAEACRQIAGPQLRRMGTIGGNVCLDTRCVYINLLARSAGLLSQKRRRRLPRRRRRQTLCGGRQQ